MIPFLSVIERSRAARVATLIVHNPGESPRFFVVERKTRGRPAYFY